MNLTVGFKLQAGRQISEVLRSAFEAKARAMLHYLSAAHEVLS
ncbi:hypothetical protein MgSA37_01023 [Mucilaginibacter gotjawali]|uniref:Uncharacterized protein n=2 Tax=Mucilaginibacter gotjawali TaxID=1550579 RepID=A0A839SP12_9SPHI|nr:hypothetical protein [Mucilaginibacter gotjawali]BAU52859.1 hypothetical protein MgSA37_01023 [Mucilaginibacter gotjawali]